MRTEDADGGWVRETRMRCVREVSEVASEKTSGRRATCVTGQRVASAVKLSARTYGFMRNLTRALKRTAVMCKAVKRNG